ncbi:MAG: MFS transporter [Anaerolineales bacterium]|nr:MFS transporter [Anaerolineales bacterium]
MNFNFFRSPLFPIFMIVFVDVLGLGITIPILPLFAKNDLGATAQLITGLTSVFFAAQLFAGPLLGRLSDKYGRRPVLIVSQIGTLGALLLTGSAVNIGWIYVARLIDGFTGGNISVAQAYLSDITDEKNRARGLGIINAAFGAGFVFGPALGGSLAAFLGSERIPFFAAAGFSLLTILLSIFLLPESLPPEKRNHEHVISWKTPFQELIRLPQEARKIPALGLLLTIAFGINLAFFAFQTIYALWFERTALAGYPQAQLQLIISGILAAVGLLNVSAQAWLVGPLVKRFGEKHLVVFGNLARGTGILILGLFPYLLTAIPSVPLLSIGGSISLPALIALLTYTAPPNQRGRVIGLNQSASALGNMIGPLLSGYIFDNIGPNQAMLAAGSITLLTIALTAARLYQLPIQRPVPKVTTNN